MTALHISPAEIGVFSSRACMLAHYAETRSRTRMLAPRENAEPKSAPALPVTIAPAACTPVPAIVRLSSVPGRKISGVKPKNPTDPKYLRQSESDRRCLARRKGLSHIVITHSAHIVAYRAQLISAPKIWEIINATCSALSVEKADLVGISRHMEITLPRQIAMYLCKELSGRSGCYVGRAFGRDHSTVHHAVRKIKDARDRPQIAEMIEAILGAIKCVADEDHACGRP